MRAAVVRDEELAAAFGAVAVDVVNGVHAAIHAALPLAAQLEMGRVEDRGVVGHRVAVAAGADRDLFVDRDAGDRAGCDRRALRAPLDLRAICARMRAALVSERPPAP